jgi:hypothetical protein
MTKARCCWCGKGFVKVGNLFWCSTEACRTRQATHAIAVKGSDGSHHFLYLPLPRQVEYDNVKKRYLLGGGAAGASKSHSARWGAYGRMLRYPGYEALILRKTWNELEKHHFRLMEKDAQVMQQFGIDANFSKTHREFTIDFGNGIKSIIEGGHMENAIDVQKYLSRERDEIIADEGSTFDPKPLWELSSRARTTKPMLLKDGIRGLFRLFTNPGGPAASRIRDFFIDHEPNWEEFPKELQDQYDPDEWVYVPGNLEDNPYISAEYESDLAMLEPWRYQQLRHNDWDVISGHFFTSFKSTVHVADLGDPGANCDWFRSLDWGYINPGCVLWWACLSDGIYYIRRDHKFSHATVEEVADNIRFVDEDLGIHSVRYTVADPAIWSPNGNTGEDINETFMRARIPVIKGKNDRPNGWQRIRQLLQLREDKKPHIFIHPDCRYLIRSLASAISDPKNPEDVDTSIDDHAIDALRYGAMSRPAPTRATSVTRPGTFNAARKLIKQKERLRTVRV